MKRTLFFLIFVSLLLVACGTSASNQGEGEAGDQPVVTVFRAPT